jgi:UDP-N-acetylglucosamine/UDP-N-acetylgalactosamine diphosphorylase
MNQTQFSENDLINTFSEIGQGQIFRFWKDLNQAEKRNLYKQLQHIDLNECLMAWKDIQTPKAEVQNIDIPKTVSYSDQDTLQKEKIFKRGEFILGQNKVAAFTVAGGQGTRLGYNGPKGSLPCTPLREAPLFQLFAENIKFIENRFGHSVWWFIMTSEENHEQTLNFFQKNRNFGLNKNKIYFFKQGMMPVFDLKGKILLCEKNQISLSPNGHGGSFKALLDSGALKIMEDEGIEYLSYFQVDNPLVYCLDPMFIGMHEWNKAEMSSKAVQKNGADEKVGTFVNLNEKLQVLEYSDIPSGLAQEKANNGKLAYNLGNIAIHLINRDFVKRVTNITQNQKDRLPYHGALKNVQHLDNEGKTVSSEVPNAIKAETFVFDAIPLAQNASVFEIDRFEEFAPIKNASGNDSLETSQKIQLNRAQEWLKAAGLKTIPDQVEISPSYAPTKKYFLQKSPKSSLAPISFQNQKITFNESGISIVDRPIN